MHSFIIWEEARDDDSWFEGTFDGVLEIGLEAECGAWLEACFCAGFGGTGLTIFDCMGVEFEICGLC